MCLRAVPLIQLKTLLCIEDKAGAGEETPFVKSLACAYEDLSSDPQVFMQKSQADLQGQPTGLMTTNLQAQGEVLPQEINLEKQLEKTPLTPGLCMAMYTPKKDYIQFLNKSTHRITVYLIILPVV